MNVLYDGKNSRLFGILIVPQFNNAIRVQETQMLIGSLQNITTHLKMYISHACLIKYCRFRSELIS